MEADLTLEGAVGLDLGPSVALGLVHFVVATPGELDGVGVAAAEDLAGDAAEGELTRAVGLEEDVGGAGRRSSMASVAVRPLLSPNLLQRDLREARRRLGPGWSGDSSRSMTIRTGARSGTMS